jgi:hypothetical protein
VSLDDFPAPVALAAAVVVVAAADNVVMAQRVQR